MDLTLFLAQVFGIYALVGGLSGILHQERMRKALQEVTRSYLIPYFDGVIALLVGLLIVLTHNVWDSLVAGVISLIGWLAIIEGVAMLLLPQKMIVAVARLFDSKGAVLIWSVVALLLGVYLIYVGFGF